MEKNINVVVFVGLHIRAWIEHAFNVNQGRPEYPTLTP